MSALRITLSDSQLALLRRRAAERGFGDVQEFAQNILASFIDNPQNGPADLQIRSKKDLEAKLIEGQKSGRATAMTDKDWTKLKTEVRQQIAARRASKAS